MRAIGVGVRTAAAALSVALAVAAIAGAAAAKPVNDAAGIKNKVDSAFAEYVDKTPSQPGITVGKMTVAKPEWAERVQQEFVKDKGSDRDFYGDNIKKKVVAIALELALQNRGHCPRGDCAGTPTDRPSTNVALAFVVDKKVTEIKAGNGLTNRQQASKLLKDRDCADGKWSNKLFQLPASDCSNPKVLVAYAVRDGKLAGKPLAPGHFIQQALTIALSNGEAPQYEVLEAAVNGSGPAKPSTSAPPAEPGNDANALKSSFDGLGLNGPAGVSFTPVGSTAEPTVLGNLTTGVAWSTAKVPLSVAALRKGGSESDVKAAITASNNEAAKALWAKLNSDAPAKEVPAAAAVDEVLRDGGDSTTKTQKKSDRPEYTPFGQTEWTLADQARFAAKLPCINKGKEVLGYMSQVIPDHDWGLGRVASSSIKGGWGPGTDGKYLVRQLAVIDVNGGKVAVTAAVLPKSGSFEDGITMLNKIGKWVSDNKAKLPGGSCA